MKLVSLISSGIDSPVATYLVSKKAKNLILIHGDIRPFTDEHENKNFIQLAKHLKKIVNCPVEVYMIPHGNNLTEYKHKCNNKFTCVFCKRMLLRYAEQIAKKENADAIVMGDSLGQVASQTLKNIRVIDQAVSTSVLRPLIGFDKEDVVRIAKEIGTYDLSILPSDGCSAVPNKPATKATLDRILEQEKTLDIDELVKGAVEESKLIKI